MTPANASPWATQEETKQAESTTGGGSPWGGADNSQQGWLQRNDEPQVESSYTLLDPFGDEGWVPFDAWVEQALEWTVDNFRELFQAIRFPVDVTLSAFETSLQALPPIILILFMTLLAWQVAGKKLGIGTAISLTAIGAIGAWGEAMVTLALVFTSVLFCILIGLPTGIWISRNDRAAAIMRPILDAMQTTPAFVYLVPIVMLFGIGNVPGVVVTIIFALPPLIRLTNLGIRQVPADLIEASQSFGASPSQMLWRVQLPVALPTIMAGINQTLMLALSMVVFASMIAVEGLGQMVLRGIGRLDMGLAAVGGLGIVLLAVVLDRITQSITERERSREVRHWYETGPVGFVYNLLNSKEKK